MLLSSSSDGHLSPIVDLNSQKLSLRRILSKHSSNSLLEMLEFIMLHVRRIFLSARCGDFGLNISRQILGRLCLMSSIPAFLTYTKSFVFILSYCMELHLTINLFRDSLSSLDMFGLNNRGSLGSFIFTVAG